MALATWDSAWKPQRSGSNKRVVVRQVVTQFQDYEQRVAAGIDPHDEQFTISVEESISTVEAIEAFLKARVTGEGLEPFNYVDESVSTDPNFVVVAESWVREPTSNVKERITVQMRKVKPPWP
jgi:phage-related protein